MTESGQAWLNNDRMRCRQSASDGHPVAVDAAARRTIFISRLKIVECDGAFSGLAVDVVLPSCGSVIDGGGSYMLTRWIRR